MRLVIAAAAAAFGLAACGPSEPASDTASTAPAADTAAPAPAAASATAPAIEGPAAGKWSVVMTAMGTTLPASEVCYTKQVSLEEAAKMQQQAGITCSEQSYRKEGDAWIGHSVCTMEAGPAGPTKMTTDSRVSGDFSKKYTMEITSKMDPPPMPSMAEQKMTMTAERIGDC
jgi:hypothetical protein